MLTFDTQPITKKQSIKIGCDIVHIPRFVQSITRSGGHILEKLFTPTELAYGKSHQSLAGMFAAKESVIKALGTKIDWLLIEISYEPYGKPVAHLLESVCAQIIDISIAHDGEYAIAYALVMAEESNLH